jgi:hypothetical protein
MFTYFYVMNDYGFRPLSLVFLSDQTGYYPDPEDIYNPNLPNFGNRNFGDPTKAGQISWGMNYQETTDLRLFYTILNVNAWS